MGRKPNKILLKNGRAICICCHYNEEYYYEQEVRFQKVQNPQGMIYIRVYSETEDRYGRLEYNNYPEKEFHKYFRLVRFNEYNKDGIPV